MRLLNKVAAIFDRTNDLLAYFAGFLFYFIMFGVILTVILRFFDVALIWMFESTEFALLWITFLATAWLLKREGHVRMELLLTRLNPRTRALLNTITSIPVAISCLIIAYYAAMQTWEYYEMGFRTFTHWRPLKYPIMLIIPIGCFFLFIQFLRRAYGYLGEWRALADKEKASLRQQEL